MLYIYSVDNDKHLNGDNKMTRKAKYIKAINKLEEAKKLLNEIGFEHQKDFDADRFACEVSMILESDNGECGLLPFVEKL